MENPCEETGHRCPYFESLSFALLDATAYAMAPNTHTERTVTPASSPMAIAEYIAAALARVLRADVSKYRPEVYKSEKSKILKKNSQSSTR